MKVVLGTIWHYPHLGGVSTHLSQLNSALRARGYDSRVISGSEFAVYAAATGTGLIERLQGLIDGARRYMEHYPRPDVFVAHDVLVALAALQAGWKPLVLTVHGYLAREYVASGAVREGSAEWNELLAWEREAYAQSDDVVAVGRKLQGYVEELSGRSVKHLPNAIDPRPFVSLPPVPMSPPFVILFAGRLTPSKGVHVLLQAAGLLEREHPELPVWWLIAGDGPQYDNLKKQAESFHRVRLLGSLPHDKMPEAYARAFVVAVPSLPVAGAEESFGLVALEALASGRPVIASRTGGLAEVVRNGVDGCIVEPGNPKAIADAVRALGSDPSRARSMGENGRRRVLQEFCLDKWVARYLEVIGGVGGSRHMLTRSSAPGKSPTREAESILTSREERRSRDHRDLPSVTSNLDEAIARGANNGRQSTLPLRITFLAVHDKLTGGALVFFTLANLLYERGHSVTIVAPTPKPQWIDVIPPWVYVPTSDLSSLGRWVPPSDVVVGMFWTAVRALLQSPAFAKVLLEQGDPTLYEPERFNPALIRTMDECYRAPVTIVSVAHRLSELLARRYGRVCLVAPPGVDTAVFKPMPELKQHSRIPRVIVVGDERLHFKGLADAFEAFRRLREYGIEFEVWHVTPVPVSVSTFPRRIIINPTREELARLYAAADVHVHPSWYETFPLPPLEAMATGTAVVATDSGGIREYGVDNYNCLLVSPESPNELCEALRRVLGDEALRQRLSLNGIRTAEQFSLETARDRFEKALRLALAAATAVRDAQPRSRGSPSELVEAYHRLAGEHLAKGDVEASAEVLRAAALVDRSNLDTWVNLAEVELARRHFRDAVRAGVKALRLRSVDDDALAATTLALERLGHRKLAKVLMRRCLLGQSE